MAQLNFDATQVAPQATLEPVPDGWYTVNIIESEVKPTAKEGAYLQLICQIMTGQFVGRKLFVRLNIQNANPVTVEIAYQQLSAICHAVGVVQVQDSSQLHGKPFEIKVIIRPPGNGYDASNEPKGFRACENAQQMQQPAQQMQQPAQQPAMQQYQQPAQQYQQPQYQQPAQQPAQQYQQPAQQPAMQEQPAQQMQQPAMQEQPAQQMQQPAAQQVQGQAQLPPWMQPKA